MVVGYEGLKQPAKNHYHLLAGNKQQTFDLGKLKEKRHAGSKVLHLSKKDDELTSHLFSTCPYAGQLWTEVIRTLIQGRIFSLEGTWE